MNKSELLSLIKESVEEVMQEFSRLEEKAPPGFPPALEKKLLDQYKDNPGAAYATMWEIHNAKNEGHEQANRVCELWSKKMFEAGDEEGDEEADVQDKEMDPSDDDFGVNYGGEGLDHEEKDTENPEENKEVDLANQIKKLADELLAMHGVGGAEEEPKEEPAEPEDDVVDDGGEGEEEIDLGNDDEEEKEPVAEVRRKKAKKSIKKKSK